MSVSPSPSSKNKEDNKHILIGKVYADWCGHCQNLKPKWKILKKQIANKVKSMPGVHIEFTKVNGDDKSKMDHLKKNYPQLNVDGYPTIFKHNKLTNEIEKYGGPHEVDDLMKWILEEKSMDSSKHLKIGGKSKKKTQKRKSLKTSKRKSSKFSFKFW
jgi:thiol-disulfide isomerase/thioredoxin